MTYVDTALEQQVFHIPERERETDIHHDHEADHLGRRVEATKGLGRFARDLRVIQCRNDSRCPVPHSSDSAP